MKALKLQVVGHLPYRCICCCMVVGCLSEPVSEGLGPGAYEKGVPPYFIRDWDRLHIHNCENHTLILVIRLACWCCWTGVHVSLCRVSLHALSMFCRNHHRNSAGCEEQRNGSSSH